MIDTIRLRHGDYVGSVIALNLRRISPATGAAFHLRSPEIGSDRLVETQPLAGMFLLERQELVDWADDPSPLSVCDLT